MQRNPRSRSVLSLTIASLVLLIAIAGCGTNLAEVLSQSASAAGRTLVDLFITDLVNAVADAADEDGALDDGDADGDDGDDGGDGSGDGDDGDGTGDGGDGGAVDGAALFADDCAACHGADGASGFAPDITGQTADDVAAGLTSGTHGAITMTDEQITALAAFLGGDSGGNGSDGSGDGSDGGSATGDPAAGETFFAGAGCGACHCADASGGCALEAPSLINSDVDTLEAYIVGDAAHPGGKQDASAQDLADLAAYLATLE